MTADDSPWMSVPSLPESVLRQAPSPSLVILLDRVRYNLSRMALHLGGKMGRWRPHVKTVKIPEVMAELVEAGVRHFKAATVLEASVLLDVLTRAGVEGDVLVAYPLVGPNLERLVELARRSPSHRLGVLSESPERVGDIDPVLRVFVDVNVGMNRTGIEAAAFDRIVAVAVAAGARFGGIHAYEGHVHDASGAVRLARTFSILAHVDAIWQQLHDRGVTIPEVVTSGTPTFLEALAYPASSRWKGTVHRVSPGTVVYHDAQYEELLADLGLSPAALVLARVVSCPSPGIVTLDAGSKSLAAEQGDPCAVALGHPGLVALKPSEEHLPMRVVEGPAPPIGTTILLVPRHVCPTVNLAAEAILVERDRLVGVVPVSARGHLHWDTGPELLARVRGRDPNSTL